MIRWLIFLTLCFNLSNAIVYDCYTGEPASEDRINELTAANALETCSIDIEPCDENEGSRLDGSCINLDNPARGGYRTPQNRMLEADFGENFEPRPSKCGGTMALSRDLRQHLLPVGKAINEKFTQFMSYFAEYLVNDILSVQDITNYIFVRPYCCEEEGKYDNMCVPNFIPSYDPVHRFTNYRCMNQTRPISYQNQGCVANNTTPERNDPSTPAFDLHNVYHYAVNVTSLIRLGEGGLLKTEIVNGYEFASDGNSSCTLQQAIDNGCTRQVPNGLIGSNIFTTLYWRHHNLIARNLAEQNSGWDDDKLFYTARDINIAMFTQIMYYEFWTALIGQETLIKEGIISCDPGFRDLYNSKVLPQMFIEFAYVMRWFHTGQESIQHMYDTNGTYVGDRHIGDYSLRVQDFAVDNELSKVIHGAFRQPAGGNDYIIDPEISEKAIGRLQDILDLGTQDIHRGKYDGFSSYTKYRDLLTNYNISHDSFDSLKYIIPLKNLELLKDVYKCSDDIELLPGIMMEKHITGGYVPATAAAIIMKQLKKSIIFDRHWYERPNRPNAYTEGQLSEVRKSTLSTLLCAVGDDVTSIQLHSFLRISPENEITSCSNIPAIDFSLWKEDQYDE